MNPLELTAVIDGQHYSIPWTRTTPPTPDDYHTIETAMRANPVHHQRLAQAAAQSQTSPNLDSIWKDPVQPGLLGLLPTAPQASPPRIDPSAPPLPDYLQLPTKGKPYQGSPAPSHRQAAPPAATSVQPGSQDDVARTFHALQGLNFDPVQFQSAVKYGFPMLQMKGGEDTVSTRAAAQQLGNILGVDRHELLDPNSDAFWRFRKHWVGTLGTTPDTLAGQLKQAGVGGVQSALIQEQPGMKDDDAGGWKGYLQTYLRAMGHATPGQFVRTAGRWAANDSLTDEEAAKLDPYGNAISQGGAVLGDIFGMAGAGGAAGALRGAAQAGLSDAAGSVGVRTLARSLVSHAAAHGLENAALQAPSIYTDAHDIQSAKGGSPWDAFLEATSNAGKGLVSQYDPRTIFDSDKSAGERASAAMNWLGMLTSGSGYLRARGATGAETTKVPPYTLSSAKAGETGDLLRASSPSDDPLHESTSTPTPNADLRLVVAGKAAIKQAMEEEMDRNPNVFANGKTYGRMSRFLDSLPDHHLASVGLEFMPELDIDHDGRVVPGGGTYQLRTPEIAKALIRISREFTSLEDGPRSAEHFFVHEVAHHLERFIPEEEYGKLQKIYAAERERAADPDVYHLKNFSEWWAHKVENFEAANQFRKYDPISNPEMPTLQRAVQASRGSVFNLMLAAKQFYDRGGRPDLAEKVYRQIKSNRFGTDYSGEGHYWREIGGDPKKPETNIQGLSDK